MLQFIKDFGEGLIALVALAVALCGFRAQRTHNRKSVTPNLHFDTFHTTLGRIFQSEISNFGVGPAVIKEFAIYFDKSKVTSPSVEDLNKGLRGLGIPTPEKYHLFDPGDFIKQGASIIMLEFKPSDADRLETEMKLVRWEITYADVYGKVFPTVSNRK